MISIKQNIFYKTLTIRALVDFYVKNGADELDMKHLIEIEVQELLDLLGHIKEGE